MRICNNVLNMQKLNTLLIQALNKTWKQDQVKISIATSQIITTFKNLKNIDIKNYIISVKLIWNTFIVKTSKPIINTELLTINETLIQNISTSLLNIWINIKNLDIKYK